MTNITRSPLGPLISEIFVTPALEPRDHHPLLSATIKETASKHQEADREFLLKTEHREFCSSLHP